MTNYPADLEAIVRRVIADVLAGAVTPTHNQISRLCLTDRRVITLADVEDKLVGKSELVARPGAVITPAAKDLLRAKSITIVRDQQSKITNQPTSTDPAILIADVNNEDRGIAFAKQVHLRTGNPTQSVVVAEANIVLADLPQPIVCEICRSGRDAVQIGAFADVRSIAAVMQPNVWVLDMKRLNLVAAVNVAINIWK